MCRTELDELLVGPEARRQYYSDLYKVLETLGPVDGLFSAFDVTGVAHV